MSGLPKIKSDTQQDSLARYAIMARKEAEQRAKKLKHLVHCTKSFPRNCSNNLPKNTKKINL